MIKKMLRAVSKMMECVDEPSTPQQEFIAKMKCVKNIVDELIKDEAQDILLNEPLIVKDATPKKPVEPKYEAVVKEGKLIEIKGFPDDGMLKLNGKLMKYADAKGKPFQNIEMV